jgi:AmiR/NasT family two-component response regulator
MATTGRASSPPTPRVAIASGIVAEQTGSTTDAAMELLSERAEASGTSIEDVAASVIEQHERRWR